MRRVDLSTTSCVFSVFLLPELGASLVFWPFDGCFGGIDRDEGEGPLGCRNGLAYRITASLGRQRIITSLKEGYARGLFSIDTNLSGT
jgi:hypothetical protein